MRAIDRVGLGPQVREHVMSVARRSFMAQRADVDRGDDDALASVVVVDCAYRAAAEERWIPVPDDGQLP